MALIPCPECAREVSDKANACPHCGNPLAATAPRATAPLLVATAPGKAVTTEATGKGWKLLQAIGVVMVCIGVVSCAGAGDAPGRSGTLMMSSSLILWGSIIFLIGRIGAWWRHG